MQTNSTITLKNFTRKIFMNKDIIKGNWKEMKGKIRQQWGNLTDDEITKMHGSYEELEGALQKKYGYNKEAAEQQIKQFVETHGYECKEKDEDQ